MEQVAGSTEGADGIDGESAVERVYELVKAMAIAFEFRPGERLNELEIARKIGVSRTPLREALNRLASHHFLVFSPRHGFFRKPLSVKEISDLYELRGQIGRGVARLAAERASDAAIDQLEADLDLAPAPTSVQALAHDERFHEALAALTGNAEIVNGVKNLNDRIRFVRQVGHESRGGDGRAQHRAIVHALRARDADRAEALIAAHLKIDHDQIVVMVKDALARIYMAGPSA
jgi:DNA-binding GntR family transcriptional regulator